MWTSFKKNKGDLKTCTKKEKKKVNKEPIKQGWTRSQFLMVQPLSIFCNKRSPLVIFTMALNQIEYLGMISC